MLFILGLDGLELTFVEKWGLENLKQEQYGKIKVPINKEVGNPISPEVWAAFLTGKNLPINFVRAGMKGKIFEILKFIRKHVNLSLGLGRKFETPRRFPKLKYETFLDITNSKEINAPFYSWDYDTFDFTFRRAKENLTLKQVINELKFIYTKNKKKILKAVETLCNVDVVFAYMHFPDVIHHHLLVRPSFIKQHYYDLDYYVLTLKEKLPTSTTFIIVSDHGFDLKTGLHSNYGFYSSNVPLYPEPKEITDFYRIVLEYTRTLDTSRDQFYFK